MTLSASLPAQTIPVYCTDEDIAVRAGGRLFSLARPGSRWRPGPTAYFNSGSPWVLNSTAVNFASNGVSPTRSCSSRRRRRTSPGVGPAPRDRLGLGQFDHAAAAAQGPERRPAAGAGRRAHGRHVHDQHARPADRGSVVRHQAPVRDRREHRLPRLERGSTTCATSAWRRC